MKAAQTAAKQNIRRAGYYELYLQEEIGMKIIRIFTVIILLSVVPSFLGCGGGGAKVQATSTTVGQEFMDLEKAYKEGVITEKQYNDQKNRVRSL